MSSVRREASTRAAQKPVSQSRPTLRPTLLPALRLVGSFKKAASRIAPRRQLRDPFLHPLAFAPRNASSTGESIDDSVVIARIITAVRRA